MVNGDAFLIPAAEGKLERLRIGDYEFWDAAFSADGRQVAFNPRHGIEAAGITLMKLSDRDHDSRPKSAGSGRILELGRHVGAGRKAARLREWGSGVRQRNRRKRPPRVWKRCGLSLDPRWQAHRVCVRWVHGSDQTSLSFGDGTGRRILGQGLHPDISPSGDEVAYSTPIGVFVMSFAGDGEARLVVPNGFGPVWSPDGKFLAFARHTECGHAVCSGRVFIVPADGGEPRAVGPTDGDPVPPEDWIR